MVTESPLEHLKDGKQESDQKTVVAGGIAVFIVMILFVGWAFLFLKRVQSGSQEVQLSSGAQEQFNFTSVQEAQQQLEESYEQAPSQQLQQIRDEVNTAGMNVQQQVQQQVSGEYSEFTDKVPESK